MRPLGKKIPALVSAVIISLLLCNTQVVFATDSNMDFVIPSQEAATFEEFMLLLEEGQIITSGGTIHATDDWVVPSDGELYSIRPQNPTDTPIVVDMGEHSLYVEGNLRVNRNSALGSGIEFTGLGGETGLVRVRTGGEAYISHAILTATAEDGYALWQEEGSILQYEPAAEPGGLIHFAEIPVGVPFSFISPQTSIPVAVVHEGQTVEDVLPVTDSVRLYWQGIMDQGTDEEDKQIPVTWDLELYQEQLAARQRVFVTGSYPEAMAFQTPVCLVVFQDSRPAVFLDSYGMESYSHPAACVNVELADQELGCRFEWSQDGETWLPADSRQSPHWKGLLSFTLTFPQDEPPVYPYYLSTVVDYPDGSKGYSDVIVVREALSQCDSGGNRGGGTDITNPPEPEEPSEPDTVPDSKPEEPVKPDTVPDPKPEEPVKPDTASDSKPEEPVKPDTSPDPKPEESVKPDTDPRSEEPVKPDTVSNQEAEKSAKPDIVSSPEAEKSAKPDTASSPEPEKSAKPDMTSGTGQKKSSGSDMTSATLSKQEMLPDSTTSQGNFLADEEVSQPKQDNTEAGLFEQTKTEKRPPLAKTLPIVAGCSAIVALIGAAGVYHSPNLRRRFLFALKKLIHIKKK